VITPPARAKIKPLPVNVDGALAAVLYDLGFVSTPEPFQRLVNQGYILAPAYMDERGIHVEAAEVSDEGFFAEQRAVQR